MTKVWVGALSALFLLGCSQKTDDEAGGPLGLGVDLTAMDKSVRAQDNFYLHVNGNWLANTEIPADKSNYGAFIILADEAEENLRAIIDESAAATDKTDGTEMQQVGDMYNSFMNVDKIENLGIAPLAEELALIGDIATPADIARYVARSHMLGAPNPFVFYVNQDSKNTTEYIGWVHQTGLGMPDRDYYLKDTEDFEDKRAKYRDYITKLFELAEIDATGAADTVLEIETAMAEAHWTREQNRDRNALYNKYTIEEANAATPGFDWAAFMDASGLADQTSIIIRQPSYFEGMGKLVGERSVADWQTYFRFKLLDAFAPNLNDGFVQANFDFRGRTLNGIEELRPRWKRGVATVEATLGEALGKIYVDRHFLPEAKRRMDEMVANLNKAFEIAINELEWMGDATKTEAQAKLAKFTPKIGYPDEWKDYSALVVKDDDLVGNVIRSGELEFKRMTDKLGKPIDRGEWFMTPQTVNAYYNPSMNEIVFPAAILQPPFFNVEADDAVNYGAIGAVIGHEFSHGFDDQGRKSDGDGTLRDWWTDEDASEFEARAGGLVAQYDAYNPIGDEHVNGAFTLGENIGDLAGLTMAYKAYQLSLGGEEAPVIEGYTGEQRFFLGWSQVWRRKYRDDNLKQRLLTDPHSPSEYRVIGIVSNMPEFYAAFDVKEGDGMYIPDEKRIKIW